MTTAEQGMVWVIQGWRDAVHVAVSLNIGGNFGALMVPSNINGPTSVWPSEIDEIWNVGGTDPTPEHWAQVALGTSIRYIVSMAHLNYARQIDAPVASLAKPSWATSGTMAASTHSADTLALASATFLSGSKIRHKSLTQYVTLEECSPGQVYGLIVGETERRVPFFGRASGPVEIRIHDASDGRVVRDWTAADSFADGFWSSELLLPESTRGWNQASVRLAETPEVIWHGQSEFSVSFGSG